MEQYSYKVLIAFQGFGVLQRYLGPSAIHFLSLARWLGQIMQAYVRLKVDLQNYQYNIDQQDDRPSQQLIKCPSPLLRSLVTSLKLQLSENRQESNPRMLGSMNSFMNHKIKQIFKHLNKNQIMIYLGRSCGTAVEYPSCDLETVGSCTARSWTLFLFYLHVFDFLNLSISSFHSH